MSTGVAVPGEPKRNWSALLGKLPTREWERLQDILDPFEQAWHEAVDPEALVDLARFLPPPDDPLRPIALHELIKADLEARWRHGRPAHLEAYLDQFPELGSAATLPPQLVFEEYRIRQQCGDRPPMTEYQTRFPRQFADVQRLARSEPLFAAGDTAPRAVASATTLPTFPGYDVLAELGRGGMGVVYRALDRRHQKVVALKTMQALDPAAIYRFKQEFRSLAGLAHRNLVTYYELLADEQHCFFTMELLEGVDFLTHVRGTALPVGDASTLRVTPDDGTAARPPDPTTPLRSLVGLAPAQLGRLRQAFVQLAEGLLRLHEAGKLHRDVKPGNVLVTPQGRVVLLDFGLTADVDRAGLHHSTEQHILGTVVYMAPEQAASLPVSAASDWYAVGVMLYETLTGQLPFKGRPLEVLLAKQRSDPLPPCEVAADVPEDLDALCRELLQRRPEGRPSGREVLRRLRAAAGSEAIEPPPAATTPLVPLIGRQRHLQALRAAFDATQQGKAVAVHVHGRSGAGKSALVQRFLDQLTESGEAVVLAGRCYEQESVPYKALDGLLDALSRHLARLTPLEAQALLPRDVVALARLFPVLRRVEAVARAPGRGSEVSDPREVRRRATAALRELFGRLGDRRPLVLAIDDLQWGDTDSAALLGEILRPPESPPLLLLACYRSEEAATSPCLHALLQLPDLATLDRRELAVEPLTPAEGQELALALLNAHHPHAVQHAEAISRESRGNPFFVFELVQALQTGSATGERAGAPTWTLHEVLWGRVQQLSAPSRQLVEMVAVAGRPLRQADACRAAEWPDEDLTALAHLRAGRLLRRTGRSDAPEIETYHDRIRETVVGRLEPAVLQRYQLRLAQVMEGAGQYDPELVAIHFHGGGETRRAGHYYALAAAEAAEALAFDRAAKLYRLALALQQAEAAEERRLRVRLAEALANAGRGADAAQEYLAATAGAGAAEALECQRCAALQFLISGHVDEGLAAVRQVLAAVGLRLLRGPRETLVALLLRRLQLWLRGLRYRPRSAAEVPSAELQRINICWSAGIGLSMVDPLQGAYFQTRSLLLALRAGEPFHLARALTLEAAHLSIGGGQTRRRTLRLLDSAQALARQVDQPYLHALVTLTRGIAAAFEGDWPAGRTLCDEAEEVLRITCTGVVWELDTAHRFALWPLMFMGEVNEMARRVPRLLQEAEERDDLYAVMNLGLVLRPFLRLTANEPERARQEIVELMGRWSQQGFHVQHMNQLHDEVQLDLYEGQGRTAWRKLTEKWSLLGRLHFLRVQQVRIFLLHLRARATVAATAEAAEPAGLLRAAAHDAVLLRRERMPWADALAGLIEASVAWQRGQEEEALQRLRAAATACDATHMHLFAAAARRCLGELLGGEEGQALRHSAEDVLRTQNIRNAERMIALLVPGLRPKLN